MKVIHTDLYEMLLFNLLFFKDENLEIGFTTKALLEKLSTEGDILTAARAFHNRT